MFMFKKVLVPVDGSEASKKAVEIARRMMEEGTTKEITILHVLQPSEGILYNGMNMPIDYPQFYEELNSAAQQILTKAAESIGAQEAVTSLLEYGPPAEIICKLAEQGNYDLIIIGNRGLNKFQRVLMGSVSSKVTTLAHCPVLVIK